MTHQWNLAPLTGTFGVELSGGRVGDPGFSADSLLSLVEQHGVLVLRDQHLTHAEQVTVARAIGEPTPAHPVVPGHPDHPEILVLNGAAGGRNARWHTDVTFIPAPPAISVLVGDAFPAAGGDTIWADLRGAYDRLAPALQSAVDQLEAVHRCTALAYWGEPFDTALTLEIAQQLYDDAQKVPPVIHPVVRVHPSTGRKNLNVNPGFTSHIVGLSRIESEHLLRLLYEHSTQPELQYRHRWRAGDVLIWDNRATSHYAVDDYGDNERRMRRVTIRGTKPLGPSGVESRIASDPLVAVR